MRLTARWLAGWLCAWMATDDNCGRYFHCTCCHYEAWPLRACRHKMQHGFAQVGSVDKREKSNLRSGGSTITVPANTSQAARQAAPFHCVYGPRRCQRGPYPSKARDHSSQTARSADEGDMIPHGHPSCPAAVSDASRCMSAPKRPPPPLSLFGGLPSIQTICCWKCSWRREANVDQG